MRILRKLRSRSFVACIGAVLAIFGIVISIYKNTSATVSADNLHITNVHAWGGLGIDADDDVQLDGQTANRVCRSNICTFAVSFDWTYQSIEPIALNDKISVPFLQDRRTYYDGTGDMNSWSVPNSVYYTVSDGSGTDIFRWRIQSRQLEIQFLSGAVGKTSFSGSLRTGKSMRPSGYSIDGEIFSATVGDAEAISIPVRGTVFVKVSTPSIGINNKYDDGVSWRLYTPVTYGHDLIVQCANNTLSPETTLSPEKEMHNVIVEHEYTSELVSLGNPSFSVPMPATSNSTITGAINGMSGQTNLLTVTSLFSKITQGDEDYDSFKDRIKNQKYSWGIYTNSVTGLKTFLVNAGDFPVDKTDPDAITITKALASAGYESLDDWKDVLTSPAKQKYFDTADCLTSNNYNNDTPGWFNISIREHIDPSIGLNTLSSSATFSWIDGNGVEQSDNRYSTYDLAPVPESIVSEVGALQMSVNDATNGGKIQSDVMAFKLQHKNGSTWEDFGELQKNSSGNYAISGLVADEEYRVVETSYPTGYDTNSLELYSDNTHTSELSGASFVASSDSGVVVYATNAKKIFTITFDPGDGTLADRYKTQVVEYGTSTTTLDPRGNLTPPVGLVFDRWTPTFDSIVTEDKTYTAAYKNATRVVRAKIIWRDANNADGVRLSEIPLTLVATVNGQSHAYDVAKVANADNDYTVEWTGMDTHASGMLIEYTATASNTPTYTFTSSIDDSGYAIVTATHNPKVHIEVQKDWDDNDDSLGARPSNDEVVFEVLADGRHAGSSFTLADGRSEDLNEYSDLSSTPVKISYSLEEGAIHGYENVNIQKVSEENGVITFLLTNKKIELDPIVTEDIAVLVTVDEEALDEGESVPATITPRNDSYPMPSESSVNVDGSGLANFGGITITEPGEYEYDIVVDTSRYADVDSDGTQITVKVNVTYDKDTDSLVSTTKYYIDGEEVDPSDIEIIIRHLDPEPIESTLGIQFPVDEELDGDITATIEPITEGAPMPEGSDGSVSALLDKDGNVEFGNVEFTEPGEYDYKITLSSDDYELGEDEFILRAIVTLDDETNTLSVEYVLCDKDGNPIDLSTFKLDAKRIEEEKEASENPNTGSDMTFVIMGIAAMSAGLGFVATQKRR